MTPARALVLLLVPLLGACATKRDLRDLRVEVASLRAAQDSALMVIQRQNRELLDSLSSQQVRAGGDLASRLLRIERQLVQVQELTGQGQQRIVQLHEELNARARELESRAADTASSGSAAPTGTADPEGLFNTALASLRRNSLVTARTGFEEFLRQHPRHALAGEAQFYVGETYAEAGAAEEALRAYARVIRDYPASPKASTALYRAGTIEVRRGNRSEARALFDRVVQSYPRSPEAGLARNELEKLGRR